MVGGEHEGGGVAVPLLAHAHVEGGRVLGQQVLLDSLQLGVHLQGGVVACRVAPGVGGVHRHWCSELTVVEGQEWEGCTDTGAVSSPW